MHEMARASLPKMPVTARLVARMHAFGVTATAASSAAGQPMAGAEKTSKPGKPLTRTWHGVCTFAKDMLLQAVHMPLKAHIAIEHVTWLC
jgi:hypothetical protein